MFITDVLLLFRVFIVKIINNNVAGTDHKDQFSKLFSAVSFSFCCEVLPNNDN